MKMLSNEVFQPLFRKVEIKDATVNIKDGDGNSIQVKLGDGDMTYTERRNIEYILDRGLLDDVREGDEVPVQVQFDAVWEYVKGPSVGSTVTSGAGSGVPTIEDALKKRGGAAFWVSTDSDTCRPYAVDIEIVINPQPGGCGDQEVILLSDFRYEEIGHGLRNGVFNFSGQCNITEPTVTRSAGS